jgi:hypothetical protein
VEEVKETDQMQDAIPIHSDMMSQCHLFSPYFAKTPISANPLLLCTVENVVFPVRNEKLASSFEGG